MKTIFAHRGLPMIAPENTLASFEKCGNLENLKWIEIDVAITADENLIIIHDDFLDRTTNMSGEISNSYYNDIKNASAGIWFGTEYEKESIPTLKDVIKVANKHSMNMNIELKGVTGDNGLHLSKKLIELLKKDLELLENNVEILLSSFNFTLLKLAQKSLPKFNRAVLFEQHAFYGDWQTIVDYLGSKTIHLEDKNLTKEKVEQIINKGYTLNIWTVNNKSRANELFQWGVNGIFTDIANELVHLNYRNTVN